MNETNTSEPRSQWQQSKKTVILAAVIFALVLGGFWAKGTMDTASREMDTEALGDKTGRD